jgi:hypothetical protein
VNRIRAIVALHALGAGVFFFTFQRYFMQSSFESAVRWSVCMALLAAILAYKQNVR